MSLISVVLLSACIPSVDSNGHVVYQDDDYLYMQFESLSNNGLFYLSYEKEQGLHFVDLGNFRKYDLKYHQLEDDPDLNIGVVMFVGFYNGQVIYGRACNEYQGISIMACDPDGTNEKELGRLSYGSNAGHFRCGNAILYNDHIYVCVSYIDYKSSNTEEIVCDFDLKTTEAKALTKPIITDGNALRVGFVYDNAYYFTSTVSMNNNQYNDRYMLYKVDVHTAELTLLRDDLEKRIRIMLKPESDYIYFGSDSAKKGEALTFYRYDLITNELKDIQFTYDLEDGQNICFWQSFGDTVVLSIPHENEGTEDMVFFTPKTGKVEFFSAEEAFKPMFMNDHYVLGYSCNSEDDYLCSFLTIEDFESRDFSKQIIVRKNAE